MGDSLHAKPKLPDDVTLLIHPSQAGKFESVAKKMWKIREDFTGKIHWDLAQSSFIDTPNQLSIATFINAGVAHRQGNHGRLMEKLKHSNQNHLEFG
jgi:hypothetical protein